MSASATRADRKTQRAAILRLLVDARGAWIALPEIMACAAQYNARLFELRRLGFHIENRTERDDAGAVHSWYRLNSPPPATFSSSADWYERQTDQKRPPLNPPGKFPLLDSLNVRGNG